MSDLVSGERVRLIKNTHHGGIIFKAGEEGILGQLYRIQDGLEVWCVILDSMEQICNFGKFRTRICTVHTSLEKI